MLGLAAVMVVEKAAPRGHRLLTPTGLGLMSGLVQTGLTL
jgi:hypothetical protein